MAQYYIHNGQLYHHGIKGQKKGRRRFQNEDGSLTELGRLRYLKGDGTLNKRGERARKKWDEEDRKEDAERRKAERENSLNKARETTLAKSAIKEEVEMLENEKKLASFHPKEKSGLEKAQDIVDATADAAKKAQQLERMIPTKRAKMDLSNMSDKQMRDEIDRAVLEKRYNDMFAPETTSKGRKRFDRILEVGGAVLAVTGSAISIAVGIKSLIDK